MDTLKERDLNRLRKGKMMLELAERKKSHVLAFVLALFFAGLGAQRIYLEPYKIAGLLITLTIVLPILYFFRN